MFRAAALVPSPPLLVPEIMGRSADEVADLRTAVLGAAGVLGSRWIAVGIDSVAAVIGADCAGTFLGYGVDVPVTLSPAAPVAADPALPLPALVAGWIRGAALPESAVQVRTITSDTDPAAARAWGSALRTELDAEDEDWSVLVLADGATTLTPKAPGAFGDRAASVQADLDRALSSADVGSLDALDPVLCAELGISGRAAWQVLSGLVGIDTIESTTLYTGAPFGVGYYVGTWVL